MQKEFLKNLDLLVEMSGSETNYDTLVEELENLDKEIDRVKLSLKLLKKSMNDSKYVKENDRIIDENIKVGLESKRQVYEKELEEINKSLDAAIMDEEETHDTLLNVQNRIKSLQVLIETLESKLKIVHQNDSLRKFYEDEIEKVNENLVLEERKKKILQDSFAKIQERLLQHSDDQRDLLEKIKYLNIRLEDTVIALATPNFYVDKYAKKDDEQLVDKMNKELEHLESEKQKLLLDPVYIAHEASEMFLDEDYTSALSLLKKLVELVNKKPYMLSSVSGLKDTLEQAVNARDEFANVISSNSYVSSDNGLVASRITHLKRNLRLLEDEIKNVKKKIKKIDEEDVLLLSKDLEEATKIYDKLRMEYEEYKRVLDEEDDSKSIKKKASLVAAFKKKKEEVDAALELMNSYQKELEDTILESKDLESVTLLKLNNKVEKINDEISDLEKNSIKNSRVKDILRMEKDKKTLKELSDDVDAIVHRQKYKKSANDIYDELEIKLRGFNGNDEVVDVVSNIKNDDYVLDDLLVDLNDFRVLDSEENKDVFDSLEMLDTLKDDSNFFSDEIKEFPPRTSSIDNNRFRVINVEPISSDTTNEEEKSVIDDNSFDNFNEPTLENDLSILGDDIKIPSESEFLSFDEFLNGGIYGDN